MNLDRRDALLEQVLALPAAERSAWLARACADAPQLLAEVGSLVQAHEAAADFLEPLPADLPDSGLTAEDLPGARLGRYKLLQKIGEGGCGVVYLAEQQESVRRHVALKVIKLGMDTKAVIARFDAERQALALMDHPNIARVLDAGATAAGRPFFVMELVRGIRITDYCDRHQLDTPGRLELFVKVCHAVQHAHQKGIVHRDLKPSNILVTIQDGAAVPKIIDFGIAKATQGRLTEHTLFTAFEQFIGTPAYVSPEQAEMGGLDIDTRSDIYSLGVLLYELLAGRPPFDLGAVSRAGLDELRRQIREREPPRPSHRLRTLDDSARTEIARRRRTDAPRLVLSLRGDLDWIVMRCLEKDRSRRYETANGLALDLGRCLRHEPVLARPPSTAYLLQKLIRRHRLGFAAGAVGALALAVGFGVVTVLYLGERRALERARTAEERARREAANAEAAAAERATLSELVSRTFNDIGLLISVGEPHLLRQVLRETAKLKQRLGRHPEIEAGLDETLGAAYYKMGDFPRAEELFVDSLALRQRAGRTPDPAFAQAQNFLGLVYAAQAKWEAAEKAFADSLQLQQEAFGPDHPDVARTLSLMGWALAQQARFSAAEHYLRLALARQQQLHGPLHPDVASCLVRLGSVLMQEGRVADAEAALDEAVAINRRLFGPDSHEYASALNVLAVTIAQDQRRLPRAIELYREASRIRSGVRNPDTHRPPPAAADSSPAGLSAASPLDNMLGQHLSLAEVESVLRDARRFAQNHFAKDSWEDAFYLALMGWVLLEEKKYGEAETHIRHCLEIRRRLRPDDWSVFHAEHLLGAACAGQRRTAEAEPLLVAGYEGMKARLLSIPGFHLPRLGESAVRLVRHFTAQCWLDRAAAWQAELASLPPAARSSLEVNAAPPP